MIINHNQKWVFVSTPKAGTHTMYKILNDRFGIKHARAKWINTKEDGECVQLGMNGSNTHSNKMPENCEDYFKFTIVRDPFERAVSSYWHLLKSSEVGERRLQWRQKVFGWMEGDTFLDFTRFLTRREFYIKPTDPMMFNSQYQWHNGIKFDKVIDLGNLQRGLNDIQFLQGIIATKEYSFSGERKNWEEYYIPDARMNVLLAYADDFREFNYYRNLE